MEKVNILTEDEESEQNTTIIRTLAEFVLDKECVEDAGCTIFSCSKETILSYNIQYRNKNYVPDVLSFVNRETHFPEATTYDRSVSVNKIEDEHQEILDCTYLGEVIICQEKISEQSTELGINFFEELSRCIIHGLLHLLGHTHKSYSVQEAMFKKQEILFAEFFLLFEGVLK